MSRPMEMPAAEAAKLVRRDGKAVSAADVFAVAVREQQVTVVTTDGRKLIGELPPKKAA